MDAHLTHGVVEGMSLSQGNKNEKGRTSKKYEIGMGKTEERRMRVESRKKHLSSVGCETVRYE